MHSYRRGYGFVGKWVDIRGIGRERVSLNHENIVVMYDIKK